MAGLPQLSLAGGGRVAMRLSTGEAVEFDPREPGVHRTIVDEDHPDYEAVRAAFQWLKRRGITFQELRSTPALRQEYASATWTERQVSA